MHRMEMEVGNGGTEKLPVCPKPRRPVTTVPEFLHPLICKHSRSSHQESSEILDMISRKTEQGRDDSVVIGCSPSCYCGSPPMRSSNPLIHDTQFIHQLELFSPFAGAKLSGN